MKHTLHFENFYNNHYIVKCSTIYHLFSPLFFSITASQPPLSLCIFHNTQNTLERCAISNAILLPVANNTIKIYYYFNISEDLELNLWLDNVCYIFFKGRMNFLLGLIDVNEWPNSWQWKKGKKKILCAGISYIIDCLLRQIIQFHFYSFLKNRNGLLCSSLFCFWLQRM